MRLSSHIPRHLAIPVEPKETRNVHFVCREAIVFFPNSPNKNKKKCRKKTRKPETKIEEFKKKKPKSDTESNRGRRKSEATGRGVPQSKPQIC